MTTSVGLHALPARNSFAEALGNYLDHLERRNYSPNTLRRLRVVLSGFGRFCDPMAAGEADVEAWLGSRSLGANARYTYIQYAAGFYRWALRHELVEGDPTARIDRPKVVRGLPRPIADAALAVALARADVRMRLWLMLGAYQGMRAQEIAGLCAEHIWDDVTPAMLVIAAGKGGRQRTIDLNVEVAAALAAYGRPRVGPLFAHRCGCAIRPQTVTIYVSRYLHGLGITSTCHALRHWFATQVYRQTLDIRATQVALGHASVATTQIYAAFAPGAGAEVIRNLHVA